MDTTLQMWDILTLRGNSRVVATVPLSQFHKFVPECFGWCSPYDPPRSILGLPRIVSTKSYIAWIMDAVNEPTNPSFTPQMVQADAAFLDKAIERVRLHRPVSICTDKAPTYRKVISEINHRYDPHFDYITHVDRKYLNNRVESDHAALKRLLGYRQSFRSLRSAKATLQGIETIRTIKNGHFQNRSPGVRGEITFVQNLFGLVA